MAAVSGVIHIDDAGLRWGDRVATRAAVTALRETYNPWSGRAYLCVEGPGWWIPVGPGYPEVRARLRHALPDVPMSSDWMDGRFPAVPLGLPPAWSWWGAILLLVGVAAVASRWGGWPAGLVAVGLAFWPLGRLRDAWVVRPEGLRGGPPWGALAPWTGIDEVLVQPGRTTSLVFTRGPDGGHRARIPNVLLPAFRARVRRLGGLVVQEGSPGLDDRYAVWRGPAIGIPWGVAAGAGVGSAFAADPWPVLAMSAWVVLGTGLLGAVVVARHGGWRFGAVVGAILLYGVVVAAVAAGS